MNRVTNNCKWLCLIFSLIFHAQVIAEVTFEIKGVNSSAKDNIQLFLNELDPPKKIQDESYLLQITELSKEALLVLGYYQAQIQVTSSVQEDDLLVILNISAGLQTHITELNVRLTGEGKNNPQFEKLIEDLPLKLNTPLHHGKYETAKNRFKQVAQRLGYFDAKYEKSLVEVSTQNSSASVFLWFDTGPRYLFGDLVFSDELSAKKQILALQNFKKGDPFNTQLLTQFNTELSETGYFRSITILPDVQAKQGLFIPLNVIASMRPEDSFNIGIGYSTDEGVRGKFRWNRPWVNEYGHSIEGNLTASIPKQEASLTYKIPFKDPLYHYFSIQTGYKMENQNDTDTNQYLVGLNRHWHLSNDWMRTVFIRYDNESGRQGQQYFSTELIIPGISFSREQTQGGINATWGEKHLISLELSNELWYSSDDLLKIYGQSKFLRTYNGHQIVVSAELGAIYTDSIYNIPSSMRFFTGGDQTIRGYDYESIAPVDDLGYLVGGLYLTVLSFEYRFPIRDNWKIATFFDAGTATDDFSEPISISTGLGVVWASPVGPIRFYIAKPLTDTSGSVAFHFMIGPEL